jgi:hypothetical protein
MISNIIRRAQTALVLLTACLAATACSDFTTEVHRVPADFPTIQEAINAADGADLIVVDPGEYAERLSIDFKTYLTIRGKGDVVIDAGGGFNAVSATHNIALKLRGLRITNAIQAGVRIDDCADTVVDGCTIDHIERFGVHVVDSTFVTITDTVVSHTEIAGKYLDDTQPPSAGTIDRCDVRNAGRHGIFLNGRGMTVRRTSISDVTNNGLICRSFDTTLDGVRVLRSEGEGIVSTAPDTTLRRCRVDTVRYSGYTMTGSGATLERCAAEDVGRVAFSLQGDTPTLSRCRATRSGLTAFQVLGNDAELLHCRVTSAGTLPETGPETAALHIRGARAEVIDCRISSAAGTGIRVDTPGALLRANRVQRTGSFGIHLTVGGNELIKNRVKGTADDPLRDEAPGQNVLDRNRLGSRP